MFPSNKEYADEETLSIIYVSLFSLKVADRSYPPNYPPYLAASCLSGWMVFIVRIEVHFTMPLGNIQYGLGLYYTMRFQRITELSLIIRSDALWHKNSWIMALWRKIVGAWGTGVALKSTSTCRKNDTVQDHYSNHSWATAMVPGAEQNRVIK